MWIITVISVKAGAVALSNPGSKLRRSLLLLRSGSHLPYLPPGFFFFFLLPRDTRASLFLCHFGLYKSPAVITGLLLIGSMLLAVRLMKPDALRSLPAANGNDGNNTQSQSLFLAFFCHVVGWNGACFGVLEYWDGIGMVDLCTCLLKIVIIISSKFSFAFKFERRGKTTPPESKTAVHSTHRSSLLSFLMTERPEETKKSTIERSAMNHISSYGHLVCNVKHIYKKTFIFAFVYCCSISNGHWEKNRYHHIASQVSSS